MALSKLELEYARETKANSGDLKEVKEERSRLRDRVDSLESTLARYLARYRDVPLGFNKLWSHPDGRRLIEDAFAHNPTRTRIALNYLGVGDIAGELRDTVSEKQQEFFEVGVPG